MKGSVEPPSSEPAVLPYKNMAYIKGPPVRPLGAVRQSVLQAQGSIPKFPPLKLDKGYEGIHGNAMAVPPPRQGIERLERSEEFGRTRGNADSPIRSMTSSRSDTGSSKSTESDRVREVKEAVVSLSHTLLQCTHVAFSQAARMSSFV